MSLINQMLKDLEERSAPQLDEHADTIKGVAWTASGKTGSKRRFLLATVAVSILCTGIAVAGFYHLNRKANNTIEIDASVSKSNNIAIANHSIDSAIQDNAKEAEQALETSESGQNTSSLATSQDTEARKMLAALVARGALEGNKSTKRKPEPARQVNKPIVMAAVEKAVVPQKKSQIQKKLRPLDNKSLAEIAYQQGYEFLSNRQHHAAEQKLLHAIELSATHAKAREMLAVLYLQQQRITAAADLLKQGMEVAPDYLPFREIYARALMAENKLPQAIDMLTQNAPGLKQHPNYHALLAGLYQQNKQYEESAGIYLNLVKQNNKQSQWWLGLAISLEKMQKLPEAVSAYKKARDLKLPARLKKYVENRLHHLENGLVNNE